jgi:hypothetical protein
MLSSPFGPNSIADQSRLSEQREVSLATRREHDSLLDAIHRLEAALGSPAPAREVRWKARAAEELMGVKAALESHVVSAEASGGLFSELELVNPRTADLVAKLRNEHCLLLDSARELEQSFSADENLRSYESLRREAADFLSRIRQHHAREVDLVYESFWTDIGVGD